MFESIEEIIGNTTHIKLLNNKTGEYLDILPQLGASFNGLKLQKDGVLYDLIDGYSQQDQIDNINYYRGMILYPFPNRVAEGKYTFEGKDYQLSINETSLGNAIHGMVSASEFTTKSIELLPNQASIELYLDMVEFEGFPFKSRLSVTYTITDKSNFTCRAIVESKDTQNQPVGIGWHPYFKLTNQVDKLNLHINSKKIFDSDSKMIPNGKFISHNIFETSTLIANHFLDHGYEVVQGNKISTTRIEDKENNITVNIWQETGDQKYNYLQIYTPKHRNSIAIEPMTCAVDAFNNGLGLICLKPNCKFEVEFGVFLS